MLLDGGYIFSGLVFFFLFGSCVFFPCLLGFSSCLVASVASWLLWLLWLPWLFGFRSLQGASVAFGVSCFCGFLALWLFGFCGFACFFLVRISLTSCHSLLLSLLLWYVGDLL